MRVVVATKSFEPHVELDAFARADGEAGALASFIGYCRASAHGQAVERLELEHYPGFTEAEIARFTDDVTQRHKLLDALVIHRVGAVLAGEPVVLVATLAVHRAEAFAAVNELMDYLKTDAPIWKQEIGAAGARWIEPTLTDRARRTAHDTERKS